jgi:hypothetical protein
MDLDNVSSFVERLRLGMIGFLIIVLLVHFETVSDPQPAGITPKLLFDPKAFPW